MTKTPTLDNIKTAYCVGIGGIGVSAAAKYLHLSGITVLGSDAVESETLDELRDLGITIFVGNDARNLPKQVDLVIYSPAVPSSNEELTLAYERKIPTLNYPGFLALLSEKKKTIAISGTHGKSTVTAMIGLILKNAGFAPTVFVGSRCTAFTHGNLDMGESNILVVEACEYQGNMRLLSPDIAVVTNVEYDHPDYYQSVDDVFVQMQEFVNRLPKSGVYVKNYDDRSVRARLNWGGKTLLYGIAEEADIMASNVVLHNGVSYFTATLPTTQGYEDTKMSVRIPGRFNVSNALAAIVVAQEMQVPLPSIRDSLEGFTGIWRRFEVVGKYNMATVVSDYAHHPTAIDATIHAAREWYENHRIIVAYQPHQHARTKELFDDFVNSFHHADHVLMSDVYDVAGREEAQYQNINSRALTDAIAKAHPECTVEYTGSLEATEQRLRDIVEPDDVVLVMGAGTIDLIARNLVK